MAYGYDIASFPLLCPIFFNILKTFYLMFPILLVLCSFTMISRPRRCVRFMAHNTNYYFINLVFNTLQIHTQKYKTKINLTTTQLLYINIE